MEKSVVLFSELDVKGAALSSVFPCSYHPFYD